MKCSSRKLTASELISSNRTHKGSRPLSLTGVVTRCNSNVASRSFSSCLKRSSRSHARVSVRSPIQLGQTGLQRVLKIAAGFLFPLLLFCWAMGCHQVDRRASRTSLGKMPEPYSCGRLRTFLWSGPDGKDIRTRYFELFLGTNLYTKLCVELEDMDVTRRLFSRSFPYMLRAEIEGIEATFSD